MLSDDMPPIGHPVSGQLDWERMHYFILNYAATNCSPGVDPAAAYTEILEQLDCRSSHLFSAGEQALNLGTTPTSSLASSRAKELDYNGGGLGFHGWNLQEFTVIRDQHEYYIADDVVTFGKLFGWCPNTNFRAIGEDDIDALLVINTINKAAYKSVQEYKVCLTTKNEFFLVAEREWEEPCVPNAAVTTAAATATTTSTAAELLPLVPVPIPSEKTDSTGTGCSPAGASPPCATSVRNEEGAVSEHLRPSYSNDGSDTLATSTPTLPTTKTETCVTSFINYYFMWFIPAKRHSVSAACRRTTTISPTKVAYIATIQATNAVTHPELCGTKGGNLMSEPRTGTLLLSLALEHARRAGLPYAFLDATVDIVPFYKHHFGFVEKKGHPNAQYIPMYLKLSHYIYPAFLLRISREAALRAKYNHGQKTMNESKSPLTVGAKVKALWAGKQVQYDGTITAVHSNGTFDIAYNDGDVETHVRRTLIKAVPTSMPTAGMATGPSVNTAAISGNLRPSHTAGNAGIFTASADGASASAPGATGVTSAGTCIGVHGGTGITDATSGGAAAGAASNLFNLVPVLVPTPPPTPTARFDLELGPQPEPPVDSTRTGGGTSDPGQVTQEQEEQGHQGTTVLRSLFSLTRVDAKTRAANSGVVRYFSNPKGTMAGVLPPPSFLMRVKVSTPGGAPADTTVAAATTTTTATTAVATAAAGRGAASRTAGLKFLAELKPSDLKPLEAKRDVKPSEVKPSEANSSEVKPSEVKPSSAEAKPSTTGHSHNTHMYMNMYMYMYMYIYIYDMHTSIYIYVFIYIYV
jgi:hypothetical protein